MPQIELTLLKPNALPVTLQMDGDVISMGRSTDCAIPIEDRFLSRRHAEIVSESAGWVVRDNGSANGTFVNGVRIESAVPVKPGDRIKLGSTELVIGDSRTQAREPSTVTQFTLAENEVRESERDSRIIHRLALELIADRPMAELFDFILDRVVEVMKPSRAAIALLGSDEESVEIVKLRHAALDARPLTISRTLVREVVRDRKVLAFTDIGSHGVLANAESIVAQNIYSALCAPLVAGDSVLGLLYVDYQLSKRLITEDDAQLAAQIARVAAIKLESARLREAAREKERLEETLEMAHAIQMRMLPQQLPATSDSLFEIAAEMRPARQVGGDFYDVHLTDDRKLYFCIGDVSGKGMPAALMMAVSRALFRSFIVAGRQPAEIMAAVNRQLCEESDETMFVTAFCGVLDLQSGEVRYATAGHNPPLVVSSEGEVRTLPGRPGIVLGYLPQSVYAEEVHTLAHGEFLFLYTDGISEATNASEEMFSVERLEKVLQRNAGADVKSVAGATIAAVQSFAGDTAQSDDLALVCIRFRPSRMP